jgi:hypothetical protein
MSSTIAPLTGFGDDPNWAVKFRIRRQDGSLPQWESPAAQPTFDIPNPTGGPIRRISQNMGRYPWTVTWRLWFASIAEYDRLEQMVTQRSTLRYKWGSTSTVGGSLATYSSIDYLELPGTKLLELSSPMLDPNGVRGAVEAMAIFERPYVVTVTPDPAPWPAPPDPGVG